MPAVVSCVHTPRRMYIRGTSLISGEDTLYTTRSLSETLAEPASRTTYMALRPSWSRASISSRKDGFLSTVGRPIQGIPVTTPAAVDQILLYGNGDDGERPSPAFLVWLYTVDIRSYCCGKRQRAIVIVEHTATLWWGDGAWAVWNDGGKEKHMCVGTCARMCVCVLCDDTHPPTTTYLLSLHWIFPLFFLFCFVSTVSACRAGRT